MSTKAGQINEVVRFRATPKLLSRLNKMAKKRAMKPQDVVRQALAEFFEKMEVE